MAFNPAPRDRADFNIAVICALELEAECVYDIFDHVWTDKRYSPSSIDNNTYTLGMIGDHNVVLVHMPGMGTDRAAVAAATIGVSFTYIKLVLVVGICGGMPYGTGMKDEEIILGDIVISESLMRYDFGRQYPNGFQRKTDNIYDTLGPPNEKILSFLGKLKTKQQRIILENNSAIILKDIQQKSPEVRYPGIENDILYPSTYIHRHRSYTECDVCGRSDEICNDATLMKCEDVGCDTSMRVSRWRLIDTSTLQSPPRIHFGFMGSGNTVMKSGHHRDALAKEGIIAVEMEGAGAWRYGPTIIIKGVCDYADSHKSKGWQKYAAATAAACAKALLLEWVPEKRDDHRGNDDVETILNKLPYVKGVEFDAYKQGDSYKVERRTCHWDTRVELLRQIQDWAQQPCRKSIFWLNGAAGTGKSTIARSVARELSRAGHDEALKLGGSFFFERGASDRGSATLFFPTIARQMTRNITSLDVHVAKSVRSNPDIGEKLLGEQFDKLIFEPLQSLPITTGRQPPIIVVVVDALDECEDVVAIRAIIDLWSKVTQITSVCLKLFLTSRPDLPVKQGFQLVSINAYLDVDLGDAVSTDVIRHDIHAFLKDELSTIREQDEKLGAPSSLARDWPGDQVLHRLTDMSVPLFIVAATICRFIGDMNESPHVQLDRVLSFRGLGDKMAKTYLPTLGLFSASGGDRFEKDNLHKDFRDIVGSIVLLGEPLSILSLAMLLDRLPDAIFRRLQRLRSVLHIPTDHSQPVQTLHLSFREFLLSKALNEQQDNRQFWIDSRGTQQMLLNQCLHLLSDSQWQLRQDICRVNNPGQLRQDIDIGIFLPAAVQYACRYWVYHAQQAELMVQDNDPIHQFLEKHFLHWFEALSILGRSTSVIGYISELQTITATHKATALSAFLEDARRFTLKLRHIADRAPLQLYASAMIFSPEQSVVRQVFGQIPTWIQQPSVRAQRWSLELQKLEIRSKQIIAMAFSPPSGKLLASASDDHHITLWETDTGHEVQTLSGHSDTIEDLMFSLDATLLVSASADTTVNIWNVSTGQNIRTLMGHTNSVLAALISPDNTLILSASADNTVRLWDTDTGYGLRKLESHTELVTGVNFSIDGRFIVSTEDEKTAGIWDLSTGQKLQTFRQAFGDTFRQILRGPVRGLTLSPDGKLLAMLENQLLSLFDTGTGKDVRQLSFEGLRKAVAFSPDNKLVLAVLHDATIAFMDVSTGDYVQRLAGHTAVVTATAFSADGKLLASASRDGTMRLWNTSAREEMPSVERHTGIDLMVFSADGRLLASMRRSEEDRIIIWDTATGNLLHRLKRHLGVVCDLAFSPNGKIFATASEDETVRLWNTSTWQQIWKIRELGRRPLQSVSIALTDNKLLALAAESEFIKLWDIRKRHRERTLTWSRAVITKLQFSMDNSLLVSVSSNNDVAVWEWKSGRKMQKFERVRRHQIRAVAISSDNRQLALASYGGGVELWDMWTSKALQRFDQPGIDRLEFAADDQILLTNRGALWIDQTANRSTSTSKIPLQAFLSINEEWLQWRGKNLLWLPHEYRTSRVKTAIHDNVIAFGLESGKVSFITLDYEKLG